EDASASSAQRASDKAAIAQAKSALAEAKESLANASLKATIDGTIASLDLAVGDVVGSSGGGNRSQGSGSGDTSTAQVTIVTPKTFVVDAQVATGDIANVPVGLQAEITVTGATDVVYGTVQTVGKVASAQSSGAATFPVTIAVTGEQDALYSGTS